MANLLRALCGISAVWALVVAFTGGFDVHLLGQRLKSTSPDHPVYAALIFAALYVFFFRDEARRRAQAFERLTPAIAWLERAAVPIVIALAIAIAVIGVRQGVLVAEAADPWGYVSQADLWLARDLIVEQPIAQNVPWPDADWTFAPLGYRPATRAGAIVPAYPPGLPVLMAAATRVVGMCGPFLISPLLGGLTIWLTYLLGVRVSSSRVIGLMATTLLATSPIFLVMVLSPMSDVPATAFFALALVLALSESRWRAVWTGAAVSMAIVIRPNLVLAGAVVVAFLVATASPRAAESPGRARVREFLLVVLGAAPLALALASFNTALYGAPWMTGYGTLEGFYSWGFAWRNLIDYPTWLWTHETPLVLLGAVPLIYRSRMRARQPMLTFLAAFVAAVCLTYLFYLPFGLWQYLRFLLPAIPVLLVLAVLGTALLLGRVSESGPRIAVAVVVIVCVLSLRVGVIRGEQALEYWQEGIPYSSVGKYVEQHLPANALVVTVQHSGSIRHYAHLLTMRWDFLAPDWWPRAVNALAERGYRPYVLLAANEEKAFRSRFKLSEEDDAPGTVVATFRGSEVKLYDPLRLESAPPSPIPAVRVYPCGCF